MNEHVNMSSGELINIAESLLATGIKSGDYYSNPELYVKIKTEFISYFKNEEVARYASDAKRNEWDEYTHDAGDKHLRTVVDHFNKDTTNTENLLDLLVTLMIWCKDPESEF